MTVGLRQDRKEYLQEHLCKIPSALLTSVIIEEITESPVDSVALIPKKGEAMPATKGFTPLVLALPKVVESSLGFILKGTLVIPAIRDFDPLVLQSLSKESLGLLAQ